MKTISELELVGRAVNAHFRYCARTGVSFQDQSAALSSVDGDIVILRNIAGDIARYRWTGSRAQRLS